jgi:hypothetical protein
MRDVAGTCPCNLRNGSLAAPRYFAQCAPHVMLVRHRDLEQTRPRCCARGRVWRTSDNTDELRAQIEDATRQADKRAEALRPAPGQWSPKTAREPSR